MPYPGFGTGGALTPEQESAIESIAPTAYAENESTPNQVLNLVPAIVIGWLPVGTPVGITESGGRFTLPYDGIYDLSLERIYQNLQKNPVVGVNITMDIRVNGVSAFLSTLPIGAATANDEPAVLPVTRISKRAFNAGDYIEIFVSAVDGIIAPVSCTLKSIRMTANLIHKLI